MSDHMKRLAAPRSWPIKRKSSVWTAKQSPGAHSVENSMPAVTILRDMIGVCDTAREAKRIIGNREMLVDGKPVKSPKEPVGIMDVVSIPKMNVHYRILLTDKGKLTATKIAEDRSTWTLCRIEGKTILKGGKYQINMSGGRNIILDEDEYKTGDTLKINFEDQKVLAHYGLVAGASAMIIEGIHAGKAETISEYLITKSNGANVVKFEGGTETVKKNVFVIGGKTPEIILPGASE
ncbi:MAG: small subunit ribosomal protein S4e [Candidatus Methanomethylophilaceae archaeon]|nr:small subunit ribosomal protein S4e [Candidatus Methanomethylophilaceae archaeon]